MGIRRLLSRFKGIIYGFENYLLIKCSSVGLRVWTSFYLDLDFLIVLSYLFKIVAGELFSAFLYIANDA